MPGTSLETALSTERSGKNEKENAYIIPKADWTYMEHCSFPNGKITSAL